MKLIIHDLNEQEWNRISPDYPDARVISDNGTIRPCNGCFSCWNRTPGECVIKDGYSDMGKLIHEADEVFIISRYTYGGLSSFCKNVFDRCLGYVLPQFEIIRGESHHQKRYQEDKTFTFIFYGHELNEEEKESARSYALSACTNFRSVLKDVIFREAEEEAPVKTSSELADNDRVILLNPSMRFTNGNSFKLAHKLMEQLNGKPEYVALQKYVNRQEELYQKLEEASVIVFCTPLYVDGLPSQLIRFMENCRKDYQGNRKRIYVLANMGLYESRQLKNLFETVRQWSNVMNFEYGGGLGVSAGELIGVLMEHLPFRSLFTRKIAQGMDRLAKAINARTSINDIYREPHLFPRKLFVYIANTSWNRTAKANGLDPKDLYRQL